MINRALNYVNFFKQFHAEASPRCANYGSTDGTPHGQAASIEALIHFANAAKHSIPTGQIYVLDAEAGASTAFLCNEPRFEVFTIDPDQDYLNEVVSVVAGMGLRAPTPMTLERVLARDGMFDACFYDYGTKERVPTLDSVAACVKTLIYVDDLHSPDLAEHVTRGALGNKDAWRCGLGAATLDEFGRYGANFYRERSSV